MRLKIELLPNWMPRPEIPGPSAFSRQGSSSAFRVSWAEYRGKQPLRQLDADALKKFAVNFGQKFGELVESSAGACRFGHFGTAVFRSQENPRTQVWIVTDGSEHILATHICDRQPEPSEVAEVQQIASSLALGPEQPKKPAWKFW